MARPRQFSNAAEKQKAYRERKKTDIQASELALSLLREAEAQKVTLRERMERIYSKSGVIKIRQRNQSVSIIANGYVGDMDALLLSHLVRLGDVRFLYRQYNESHYEFTWFDEPSL